jgi:hypothetical protein
MRHAAAYNAKVAEIRADATLSPLGRRRQLQELYATTKAAVDPLKADLVATETDTRAVIERRLFGLPRGADAGDVIAFRDAQDRVAGVKSPTALAELMERASGSGDETLLRAAAQHAWTQSRNPLASADWDGLVAEYGRQRPQAGRDLEQFTQMNTSRGRTQEFADRMAMAVSEPAELRTPEAMMSDVAPPKAATPSYFAGAG